MKFRVGDFIEHPTEGMGLILGEEREGFIVEWKKYPGDEMFMFLDDLNGTKLSNHNFSSQLVKKSPICIHHWIHYEGFREAYDFCNICGKKDFPK